MKGGQVRPGVELRTIGVGRIELSRTMLREPLGDGSHPEQGIYLPATSPSSSDAHRSNALSQRRCPNYLRVPFGSASAIHATRAFSSASVRIGPRDSTLVRSSRGGSELGPESSELLQVSPRQT